MSDLAALKQRRQNALFPDWKGTVPDDKIAAAVDSIGKLIDRVVSFGGDPDEEDVRRAASDCVKQFNELDDGRITTMEREDIADAILGVVQLAGFEADEDWIEDREW
jgi:hypothetical protein